MDWPAGRLAGELRDGEGAVSAPFRADDGWVVLAVENMGGRLAAGGLTLDGLLRDSVASSSSLTGSTTIALLDSTGEVLAEIEAVHGDHSTFDASVAEPGQAAVLTGPEGPQVVATSPVGDTGWVLAIAEPWEHITSPALSLSLVAPLVLIPAFLLTLVGVGFGARRVIAPLRQLEQQADRLAEGDYTAAKTPVGGIAEVRHLQQTMAQMADRIHNAQKALQSYIGAITRAQEDERRRLARELHDETIQDLIALDQRLQMLAMDLREADSPRAQEVGQLHRAANSAIEEVRRMMRALRPTYLEDLGLSPALEMLARDAAQEIGIPVSFHEEGQPRRLAPEPELALYRIVQQALSNIGRHARASQAWVTLTFQPGSLTTVVRDDGQGFALPGRLTDFIASSHFGLMGMKERAELVGGSLTLESAPGAGTVVHIDLPVEPAGDS
jgi:signal transduction histidine kinase